MARIDGQNPGENGVLVGIDWNTIGTGGQFTDVQAMIDAGETKGILISDVTEDSDIAVPAAGLHLHLNDFTLTLGTNQFTFAGAFDLTVEGNNPNLSEIDYTAIAGGADCILADTVGSVVRLSNFKYDNNSAVNNAPLCERTAVQFLNNLIFEIEDSTNTNGIEFTTVGSVANGITITGGGAACSDVIVNNSSAPISNVVLQGTFNTGADTISNQGMLSNISGNTAFRISMEQIGAALTNFKTSSGAVSVNVASPNCNISNGFITSGSLTITTNQTKVSNCLITTLDITSGVADFNEFTNCEIGFAVTVAGDRNHFSNCSFNFGITVSSGAIDNGFSNCDILGAVSISDRTKMVGCKVGADAGGGSNTITVAAGTGTQLGLCSTDAVIIDSGVDTIQMGNNVY